MEVKQKRTRRKEVGMRRGLVTQCCLTYVEVSLTDARMRAEKLPHQQACGPAWGSQMWVSEAAGFPRGDCVLRNTHSPVWALLR